MNQDSYIFSQIVDLVSDYELNKCIQKYISSIISVSKQRSLLSQLYLALIKTVTGEYGVTLLNILSILLENYTYIATISSLI